MKFRFVATLSDADLQTLMAMFTHGKSQPCVGVPMPSY